MFSKRHLTLRLRFITPIVIFIASAVIIAQSPVKRATITPQRQQDITMSQVLYHYPTIWHGTSDTLRNIGDSSMTQWIPIGMSLLATPNDWETIARHMQRFVVNVTVDTIKTGANGSYQLAATFYTSHDTTTHTINADSTNFFASTLYSSHPQRGIWVFPQISRQDSVTVAYPLRIFQPGYIRFSFRLVSVTNNIKVIVRWRLVGVN